MLRAKLGLASLLVVVSLAFTCPLALAAEFSADTVRSGSGQPATGLTYVKGQNLRQEMTIGKSKQIVIFNAQKKMIWSADPAKKTYWGQPVAQKDLALRMSQMRGQPPSWMKTKRAGTETVSGYPCEKTLAEGRGIKATVWYSKQLNLAVRTQVSIPMGKQMMTSQQEYRNIKQRQLPEALFLPPAGYKQVARPTPQVPPGAGRRGAGPRGGVPRGAAPRGGMPRRGR